ncbi:hypothetical protein EC968_008403 [Mortierella alpina]|nr:hypothetical protein EC968_008403 [Mortierella alpina]
MDRKLYPEMVHVITKTLTKSPKKGVRIANEWHCESPTDPSQEDSPVDAFARRKDLVLNLTVDEATVYNRTNYLTVQSLTVTDPSETLFGVECQESTPPHNFVALVMSQHLGLDSIQPHKINWFLRPVSCFPCLRSLVLTDTYLDREGALLLWNVFPQLEVLSLMDVHFLDMSGVHEKLMDMLCPRLAKVYLHYSNGGFPMEDQYQLLLACPSLLAFHWVFPKGNEEHVFKSEFIELRQTSHPEKVREIEELHIVGEMDDYGLALAMNNMPGIRSLSLSVGNQIGVLSIAAMCNIAANLTRFESHSPFTTSATVELVLYSCPLLHTLIARKISAVDATRDKQRKWICARSLKVLCLSFAFESHEVHLQDEVYERLAEFTRLEQLIMHEPCNDKPGDFGLRLRLAQGLGRLSTLSNMSFLSTLDDFTQTPRMEEVKWMEQHWPKLRRYHCAYSGFSMVHQ